MNCTNCGAVLEADAAFCTACGTKVEAPVAAPVEPAYQAPIAEAPVYQAPIAEAPVYQAPVAEAPVYQAPVAEAPVYQAPVEPAYQAPVAEAPVYQESYQAPVGGFDAQYQNPYAFEGPKTPKRVGFGQAFVSMFKNIVNFKDRAVKSEFWFGMLALILLNMVCIWIPVIGWIVSLGLGLVELSLSVRRLHDIGKRGTFMFMGLIPIAGFIILIVNFCKASDGDNQFGPVPQ